MLNNNSLLTPAQVAQRLQVRVKTLSEWRYKGFPKLKYVKIGRLVRYRPQDIELFANENLHEV